MTDPTLHTVLSGGAGTVDYAWHVAGMPWVCTSSESLSAFLRTSDSAYFLFCPNGYDEHDLGDHMAYLTCLQTRGMQWSWKHDDAEGLTGGAWSVNVAEIQPGVDWTTIGGYSLLKSSPIFGIPGLSQVFDAANDTAIAFGELAADIDTDDTSIMVKDIRRLGRYFTQYSGSGFIVWIGHEAILCSGYTDNSDGTFTMSVATDGRGIYRTRPQPHIVNEYAAMSEYVATAPLGGIAGRPACLWAFASGDGGATYGSPTLVHHGKVLQGISIKNGMATVKCSSPIEWLKSPSAVNDYAGVLRRYVLQRGNIGTLEGAAYGPAGYGTTGLPNKFARCPHVVIHETDIDGNQQVVSIWLCEKNSAVSFDSVDDLLLALQKELDLVYANSSSQLSGDDSAFNPKQNLWYKYNVSKEGLSLDIDSDDSWWEIGASGRRSATAGGPIATVFGLIHPTSYGIPANKSVLEAGGLRFVANTNLRRDSIAKRLAYPQDYPYSLGDRIACFTSGYGGGGYVGVNAGIVEGLNLHLMQVVPPRDKLHTCFIESRFNLSETETSNQVEGYEHDDFYPQYYYEYGKNTELDPAENSAMFQNRDLWCVPQDGSGNFRLWMERIDGRLPLIGATLYIGSDNGMPRWQGEIDDSGDDGDFFYVDVSSVPDVGNASALEYQASGTKPVGTFHILSWVKSVAVQVDPWAVSQGSAPVSATDVVEIFKAALGASDSLTVAPSQSLFWVPEVGYTGELGYSWIDWDDLVEKIVPIMRGEKYIYRPKEQSFWETLSGFLKTHGLIPYLELSRFLIYDLWQMKFRPIGVVNISDAVMYGRGLNSTVFADEYNITRDVASGHTYSGMTLKLNYTGEEFAANVEIKDKSAYAQNGYASKIYVVEDRFTHVPALAKIATDKTVQSEIASKYTSAILPHLSRPRPISTADCTARAWLLPVGGDVVATDAYGKNPFTGKIGYAGLPGLITDVTVNLDTLKARCSWRLARSVSKGWAPALFCPANCLVETNAQTHTHTVALSGANAASEHEFSASTDPADWSRFDCWDFDPLTKEYVARSCACGDYAVRVSRADYPSGGYLYGTCRVTGLEDGGTPAMTLTLDGTAGVIFQNIIEFGHYDNAEDCQRENYVAFCGDDGLIGTDEEPGDTWV